MSVYQQEFPWALRRSAPSRSGRRTWGYPPVAARFWKKMALPRGDEVGGRAGTTKGDHERGQQTRTTKAVYKGGDDVRRGRGGCSWRNTCSWPGNAVIDLAAGIPFPLGRTMGVRPEASSPKYWAMNGESLFAAYGTSPQGLPLTEAEKRIADYGHNVLGTDDPHTSLRVLWSQLRSPLLLLLVFAAGISMAMGQWSEALLVGSILGLTVGIGFKREFQAFAAVAALQRRVGLRARVRREGQPGGYPWRMSFQGTFCCWPPGVSFLRTRFSWRPKIFTSAKPSSRGRVFRGEKIRSASGKNKRG